MGMVGVNGIELYSEVHGNGEPLVLIAGLTAHSQHWSNQVPVFSKHFKTILLDNRNSGRSDVTDQGSIKLMADDVVGLMDALQVDRAHLVGRSMGGYIAQQVAISHPARVNRLVLESTAPVSSTRNNLLLSHLLQLREQGLGMRELLKNFLFWMNPPLVINDPKAFEQTIEEILSDPYFQSLEGFRNQVNAILEYDARKHLNRIQSPTLVVCGKEDILITNNQAEALILGIPNAKIIIIDGSGHDIHADQAERFNEVVLAFLKGN